MQIKSSEPLIRDITMMMRWGQFDRIDDMIDRLRIYIHDANALAMITMLRTTCAARSKLPAWRKLLSAARYELDRRGEDTDKILRGLHD